MPGKACEEGRWRSQQALYRPISQGKLSKYMDRNWDVPVSSARSWFRKQSIDRSTKDHVVSPLHKTPSPTTPPFSWRTRWFSGWKNSPLGWLEFFTGMIGSIWIAAIAIYSIFLAESRSKSGWAQTSPTAFLLGLHGPYAAASMHIQKTRSVRWVSQGCRALTHQVDHSIRHGVSSCCFPHKLPSGNLT